MRIIYQEIIKNIKETYENDNHDYWQIGFSGGKDSSVLVQLLLLALKEVKVHDKIVHILTSDTRVENPVVIKQIYKSVELIEEYSKINNLPVITKVVVPDVKDRFFYNWLGRGYPLANNRFRWCTTKMKIKPMNDYNLKLSGNALKVLGTRYGESVSRDNRLKNNNYLNNYLPIINLNLNDIWNFLQNDCDLFFKSNNAKLSWLYEESADVGECASSLDDKLIKTCGGSRWGCWLCPLIVKNTSNKGFISNGYKEIEELERFSEKWKDERDLIENRDRFKYIVKKDNSITFFTKTQKLKFDEKRQIYYLPKKRGRDRIDYQDQTEIPSFGSMTLEYRKKTYAECKHLIEPEERNAIEEHWKWYEPHLKEYLDKNK